MEIKTADEFVTIIKKLQMELQQVELIPELDFLGCSYDYVTEKLNSLNNTVQFYKNAVKSIYREQKISSAKKQKELRDKEKTGRKPIYTKEELKQRKLDSNKLWRERHREQENAKFRSKYATFTFEEKKARQEKRAIWYDKHKDEFNAKRRKKYRANIRRKDYRNFKRTTNLEKGKNEKF